MDADFTIEPLDFNPDHSLPDEVLRGPGMIMLTTHSGTRVVVDVGPDGIGWLLRYPADRSDPLSGDSHWVRVFRHGPVRLGEVASFQTYLYASRPYVTSDVRKIERLIPNPGFETPDGPDR